MSAELIFLRHAEPRIQIDLPSSQWELSSDGTQHSVEVACSGVFDDVQALYSSEERKAYQTACRFAIRIRKRVEKELALNELNRDGGFYMTSKQYKAAVNIILGDRSKIVEGWESANRALMRFRAAVNKISSDHPGEKVLIVTHGIVMTLYFSNLLNDWSRAQDRWSSIKYLSWGVVEDHKVVKDVIK